MAVARKVCIIGGGAAGVGLWWTLSQSERTRSEWDVTLIHDRDQLGGHALTVVVDYNGKKIPVDTGVQFYIPLLYPTVDELVKRTGVPVRDYTDLKVACAFPRLNGQPRNWGNFEAYRGGGDFAMYTDAMYHNAERFQDFIDVALLEGWGSKTVKEYFDGLVDPYEKQDEFLNYFLYPYLSIINGYGRALPDQVTFDDLVPLFAHVPGVWPGLGSFTHPGSGYRRFLDGASSLVQAMADQAHALKPAKVLLNSNVLSVSAASELPGPVEVTWDAGQTPVQTGHFDKVVITTDMHASAKLLNNKSNSVLWNDLYWKYLDPKLWTLLPGKCYIHTDEEVLSPDLRQQEESLQFTAYFAQQQAEPYYDLLKTYTTYIEKNIRNDPSADGLYLTMYGYIPDPAKGDTVPREEKVIFAETWTHGMWLPNFMLPAKKALHLAQGKGVNHSYPGQLDTGIYFAGNNTTSDSLEFALASGEVIANYAFGAPFPLGWHLLAYVIYGLCYHEYMFPKESDSKKRAHLWDGLAED